MGSPTQERARRHQRSMSSNQPIGATESNEEQFPFGTSSHGEEHTHPVLVNLRRSMAEHLRQKLQEKLHRQFGEFLTVCSISQNSGGKLEALECEITDEYHYRIIITCETNCKFVVFSSEPTACRDEGFSEWLDAVMTFGVSGRCSSLSALFQFMYLRRPNNSTSSSGPCLVEPFGQAIRKALDAAHKNRPHQAIDVITEACRVHGVVLRGGVSEVLPEGVDMQAVADALFIRCSCYAKAGMFTIALSDADVYLELFSENQYLNSADVLFWRGFSLEGLLRPHEALDGYMAALDADPTHERAQEQFHSLFEVIRQQNEITLSPSSSQLRDAVGRPHRPDRGRSHTNDSVADSHTSGTTASRRSSRSTTPTSSGSERDD